MRDLRSQLLLASFRGVYFHVASSDASGLARRSQLHEFPKRDQSYAEDLGGQTAVFDVDGFSRWEARDALIAAARQPGPGELVHPIFGPLWVVCTACEVRESTDSVGLTRFRFTFVAAGASIFPIEQPNTGDRVQTAVADLRPELQSAFAEGFLSGSVPQWSTDLAVGWVRELTDTITQATKVVPGAEGLAQFNLSIFSLANLPAALVANPVQLASNISRTIQQLADLSRDPLASLRMLRGFYGAFGDSLSSAGPPTSPARVTSASSRTSLVRLVRGSTAGEAARVTAQIPLASYDDAVGLRRVMTELLDGEITAAGDAGEDDALRALTQVHAEIVRDLKARGGALARVRTIELSATVPAVVLAQRLYADADRDQELVDRNGLRHPLFVPAGVPIEVLSA